MASTLLDELTELRTAYDALLTAKKNNIDHQKSKPWIIDPESISLADHWEILMMSPEQREKALSRLQKLKDFEHFYKAGMASCKIEDDNEWCEAVAREEQINAGIKKHEEILGRIEDELAQTQKTLDSAKQVSSKQAQDLNSCNSKLSWLNEQLEDSHEHAKTEEEGIKLRAKQEVEKKIQEYESEISAQKITAGGVIKKLLIGWIGGGFIALLLGSFLKYIAEHSFDGTGQGVVDFIIFILFAILIFGPLAKYIYGSQKEVSFYNQQIKNLKNSNPSAEIEEIRQKRMSQSETLEEEIRQAQKAIEEAQKKHLEARGHEEEIESQFKNLEAEIESQKAIIEKLTLERKGIHDEIRKAQEEFYLSLEGEFSVKQQAMRKEYEAEAKKREDAYDAASKAVDKALFLPSIDVAYSLDDLEKLSLVIDKLRSCRASTLPEALNAVDTDLRAERMHSEHMAATRAHNAQIAAQEKESAENLARIEREKAEQLRQIEERKARELAAAEHERNRLLKEQADMQLKLQEEQAARVVEHQRIIAKAAQEEAEAAWIKAEAEQERLEVERLANDKILRLQNDATAAASAAAAAEEQRLWEQREAYERTMADEEARRQALIEENIRHCLHCRHRPPYSIESNTFCSYGGWKCGESDRCGEYVAA